MANSFLVHKQTTPSTCSTHKFICLYTFLFSKHFLHEYAIQWIYLRDCLAYFFCRRRRFFYGWAFSKWINAGFPLLSYTPWKNIPLYTNQRRKKNAILKIRIAFLCFFALDIVYRRDQKYMTRNIYQVAAVPSSTATTYKKQVHRDYTFLEWD